MSLETAIQELRQVIDQSAPNMDVRAAASFIGVKEGTMRRYIREGKVPYFKIEGNIRFSRTELLRWAEKGKVKASEQYK